MQRSTAQLTIILNRFFRAHFDVTIEFDCKHIYAKHLDAVKHRATTHSALRKPKPSTKLAYCVSVIICEESAPVPFRCVYNSVLRSQVSTVLMSLVCAKIDDASRRAACSNASCIAVLHRFFPAPTLSKSHGGQTRARESGKSFFGTPSNLGSCSV
ncbi:MAG: hypothetical protein MHM6MM_002699 [Cercozoa sp. M6MM]